MRIEDLKEADRTKMGAMLERTARMDNERKTKGMNMERRMELVYLRIATSHDGEAGELLEERAGLIEDLHLAGLIEDVKEEEKQRGAKRIWNEKKTIKSGIDGGSTEIAMSLRRRTKLMGFKGIRKMMEEVKISITLDDRKMWMRNATEEDLIMEFRRNNRPSMIGQDGEREEIGLERYFELSRKSVLMVGAREGKRLRGYKIEGRVLEDAIPKIMLWIVEGYLYSEAIKDGEEWLWGERSRMGRGERWEMMVEWEKKIEDFQRPRMGREAMVEYMRQRPRRFLPREEGRSAPGAGGILSFYQREDWEEEEGDEEEGVRINEVADALISAVAFGGREIIRFQSNQLRAIEKEGKRIMKQSSAQL